MVMAVVMAVMMVVIINTYLKAQDERINKLIN